MEIGISGTSELLVIFVADYRESQPVLELVLTLFLPVLRSCFNNGAFCIRIVNSLTLLKIEN